MLKLRRTLEDNLSDPFLPQIDEVARLRTEAKFRTFCDKIQQDLQGLIEYAKRAGETSLEIVRINMSDEDQKTSYSLMRLFGFLHKAGLQPCYQEVDPTKSKGKLVGEWRIRININSGKVSAAEEAPTHSFKIPVMHMRTGGKLVPKN